MWFGVSDEVLVAAVVRPVQFQDIWSRSGVVSPERGLAMAVVQEALNDLAKYRYSKRRRGQRLYWEAYAWVADDDREWPYSFVNLCEAVGLSVESIRGQILDSMTPARRVVVSPQTVTEQVLGKAA